MAILNPGDASKQMKEMADDLKALSDAHRIMEGDQIITSALAIAEYRMLIAAQNYIASCAPQQQNAQPTIRRVHHTPGTGQEGKPYARTDVRPPTGGIGGGGPGVGLPIGPLNTPPVPPQVSRVPAQGNVATAPGLPDAVVPQGAQLHPRTLARIRQAQGLPPEGAPPASTDPTFAQQVAHDAGAVVLPHTLPPTEGGDLPDVPLLGAPFPYPGSPPPTR